MSSVFRRGAKWYVRWTDAAGRVHRSTTSAKTEREARALLAELDAGAVRVKLGLEAAPIKIRATLQQLCEWWLDERCAKDAVYEWRARLTKHVFNHELGRLPLQLVTPDVIEARFIEMERGDKATGEKPLKPATINRLRNTLRAIFNAAAQPPRRWQGENPVVSTRAREVVPFDPVILSLEQIELVLPWVDEKWRGVIATAAYLGLRKGEIFALRKTDYDPRTQTLRVGASHQRDTTKGQRIDVLPVPAPLQPWLERAMKSRTLWLFPGRGDKQRTKHADPQLRLRAACAAVGIVDHWKRWCRRCQPEVRVVERIEGPRPAPKKCAACGMVLWVRGVHSRIRLHDLRHGLATNLIKAGVPLPHVQRIIRHADIRTTVNTYGHLANEDLRGPLEAVNRMQPTGPDPPRRSTESHRVAVSHTNSSPK